VKLRLRFATNRNPTGNPVKGFGGHFSPVHPHNLRFGELSLESGALQNMDGTKIAQRLAARAEQGQSALTIYPEDLAASPPVLGSERLFREIKADMDRGLGTIVYIHGYGCSFFDAVGNALALQHRVQSLGVKLNVVLFSWPSDGVLTPVVAYKSDREDAATSGLAFSRAFQKLYGHLQAIPESESCGSPIHLLCHSMGNFVLENTLWHLCKNMPGRLPRIFSEVVLASADVDSDAFESAGKLGRLPEISRRITVYYNRGDKALRISDLTKGNEDRLGASGPRHPLDVPTGVVNVDCSEAISGVARHGYYLDEASVDISATLKGTREDKIRHRKYLASSNAYVLSAK
jgi:esterase/lipase superfamily enzyme